MKKFVAALASLTLLAGCSSSPVKIAGRVVSCSVIESTPTKNSINLDCLDGSSGASINSLKGPMVVNVWGSWCGPCKAEMPILRSFSKKAEGKIALIGVDVEEASIEDGRSFVKDNGITWPNLFDAKGSSRTYFGMGVPVTWFIAPDGSVAYKHIGVLKNEIDLITLTSKYLGVKL
jgi:cytochrome c biogenesis protein CcmG/thiol:disulfide interchange protein DsbE